MANKVIIEIDVTDHHGQQEAQDCLNVLGFRCALEEIDNRMRRFLDDSEGEAAEALDEARQIFFDVLDEYDIELWTG